MKIQVISLLKNKEPRLFSLETDYQKRLSRFFTVETADVKRESIRGSRHSRKDWEKVKRCAGKSLLILLDEKGKSFTSQALAKQLDVWSHSGRDLSFVIGGPEGFSPEMKGDADLLLSLSPLTFPHKLVSVILWEALYRANDILRQGPYHRSL